MKQSFGERWVRRAGYWARRQPSLVVMGLFNTLLFLALSFAIYSNRVATVADWMFWPVFWLLFTLIQFERREFYKIIKRLEDRVSELEANEESAVSFEK